MRVIGAGFRLWRREPASAMPLVLEGCIAAALIGLGVLRADGANVIAGAVFPFDVYGDVRNLLARGSSWGWAAAGIGVAILLRSAALAATLWLADSRPAPMATAWRRTLRLGALAAAAFVPAAVLLFAGVAIRYAPFVWVGAALGLIPGVLLLRSAVNLDVGDGPVAKVRMPELGNVLAYAYLLCAAAAVMSVASRTGPWAAAAIVALTGPFNALVFLGWREHARAGTYPGGGRVVLVATAVGLGALGVASIYDRNISEPATLAVRESDMLLILGGADSTSRSGALFDFDARWVGFPRASSELLSYRSGGRAYAASDTHADLTEIAHIVSDQIEAAGPQARLLGHSQAAPILDRIMSEGLSAPPAAVVISAPPPFPPPFQVPPPGENGPGRPGADLARGFSWLLRTVGMQGFDIDAPAAPVNLSRVEVSDAETARLAVWALADSVWLDGDWRRPGEENVVVLSDHVGATRDNRALTAASRWYAGQRVAGDETSWRSWLVTALQYSLEPWRP